MHLLELFSGTGSVGRVFEAGGWKVTSVDILPRFGATLTMNVLDLSAGDLAKLDLLWASPPCTHYSMARTTAKTERDLVGSDRMVQKCLDLARELDCPFFLENPVVDYLSGGQSSLASPILSWITASTTTRGSHTQLEADGDLDQH